MHIWEIEALILADIDVFNQKFETSLPQVDDVMLIPEPKEYLQSHAKYREAHCATLLSEADLDTLSRNCRYFDRFRTRLDARLGEIDS